jgi:hypothetical protein
MIIKKWTFLGMVLTALILLTVLIVWASPPERRSDHQGPGQQETLGTAFTYQGRLKSSGTPVNETCSMAFRLYDQGGTGGNQVGSAITTSVAISDGLFTVNLDFGSGAFTGDARWLGIRVSCPGDGGYTDLGRQGLTAIPYALYTSSAPWSGLTNVPAGFADGIDNDTTYTAGMGITLTGTEFGVDPATVALSTHTHLGGDITSAVPTATLALSATQASWGGLSGVPAGFADEVDDVGQMDVRVGEGLTRTISGETITLTVTFSGTGSASTVARSDHAHIGDDITSAVPTATLALSATQTSWNGLTDVPTGFADDIDNDTTYSVGAGLVMTGTEISADFSAVAFSTHTHVCVQQEALIPTSSAADWEFFTIGSDTYLAVANRYNGSTYNINSKIYRWNGTSFTETQSIPTNGAADWEFFTIGSDTYLAVANSYNGSTWSIDSKVYRWNGTVFTETQPILTHNALDWESFTIGSDTYLAVANGYKLGDGYNTDSKIYRWNGTSFTETQSIPTNSAVDWESFILDGDTYLVVANNYTGSTHNIDSKIYRWNGTIFVEFQSIPTNGAYDWEFFTIGGNDYLAVANGYESGVGYDIDSKIYRWNGTNFVEFQSIPTFGAHDWEFFTIGSDTYLALANERDDSTHNIDSKVYRWNGTSFAEFQSIPTSGVWDWESFTIGSDAYLVVANRYDDSTFSIDSVLYRLQSCCGSSCLWGKNSLDAYYGIGHVGIGTTTPQSALQVEGYVQLDTLTAAPPAADCDEASERGRVKVDIVNSLLFICTNSGWVSK